MIERERRVRAREVTRAVGRPANRTSNWCTKTQEGPDLRSNGNLSERTREDFADTVLATQTIVEIIDSAEVQRQIQASPPC